MQKNRIIVFIFFFLFLIFCFYNLSFLKSKKVINTKVNNYYSSTNNYNYFGVLKIPKINLENIIYNKNDDENNVNKNVLLVNDNLNLIVLAAHSGDSSRSYFKNLYKLKIGDILKLDINKRNRVYELFKIMEVAKTGKVKIYSYNYPTLVLITCSRKDKNKQEVYYARLSKSVKYAENNKKT